MSACPKISCIWHWKTHIFCALQCTIQKMMLWYLVRLFKKLSLFIHALMFSIDSSGIKIVVSLCDYSISSFAAYYSSTIERNIFYLRQINKSIYPFKYATELLMNYNSELEHCYKVIENIRRYFYIPDVRVYLTSKLM